MADKPLAINNRMKNEKQKKKKPPQKTLKNTKKELREGEKERN